MTTTIVTTETAAAIDASGHSIARRLRLAAISALLGFAALLGVSLASAAPAEAATGTTYVTVCAPVNSANSSHAVVNARWYNGSAWTTVSSASLRSGCGTVTLTHNGYFYFQTTSYALVPCTEYVWNSASSVYVKQNLPASARLNMPLAYYGSYNLC